MAQNSRARRSPLRPLRYPGLSEETTNMDNNRLNQSFTSVDEHVIRMRTLRSSPRRRTSLLNTSEISLLGSPGMSPDSSFDTSFNTSFGSDISTSTPIQGPRIQTDRIRKRLVMLGHDEMDTDEPVNFLTPSKRQKGTIQQGPAWKRKLSALTQDQLVNLIDTLAKDDPNFQQNIEKLLPAPDVSPLLENLEQHRHCIFKSLPHSKWGSSRDAFCYRRVKTHLDNFKMTCVKQGKQLLESDSWEASVEYSLKAVDHIERLPDWDNVTHNKTKQHCYKHMAAMCKSAIKHSNFDKNRYMEIKAQIQEAIKTTLDFCPLIDQVEKKINKCK